MLYVLVISVKMGVVTGFTTKLLHPSMRTRTGSASLRAAQQSIADVTPVAGEEGYSFIRDELRSYAMKLHTKDQAPREGQQPAQTPVKDWTPGLDNYLCFLADSLAVYECMDAIVRSNPTLVGDFGHTGLERAQALKRDITWITTEYAPGTPIPPVGEPGISYVSFLQGIQNDVPRFMCHYYNHYFAHTAGGLMIGKKMAKLLLEGHTLDFYKWQGNVRELMGATKDKIDALALTWDDYGRRACVEETENCFKYGGQLNSHFRPKG